MFVFIFCILDDWYFDLHMSYYSAAFLKHVLFTSFGRFLPIRPAYRGSYGRELVARSTDCLGLVPRLVRRGMGIILMVGGYVKKFLTLAVRYASGSVLPTCNFRLLIASI